MVPDLPCADNGVPDDSEAPAGQGDFAWHAPASLGSTEYTTSEYIKPAAKSWRRLGQPRTLLRIGMALGVTALAGTLMLPPAVADPLDAQHKKLQQQISQTQQDMNESSQQASAAAVALTKAQQQLSSAEAALAKTQKEVKAAAEKDAQLAAKLKKQQAALARAKAEVEKGRQKLAQQKALVGEIVRNQFQKQSTLLPLAMLTTSTSANDLEKKLQLSHTMLDTNQSEFESLTTLQQKLTAEQAKQATLEKQVAADRAAAAANLKTKQQLQAQAKTQEQNVASLVSKRKAAEAAAKKAAAADEAHYDQLKSEDAAVQKRIAERIAREKAAAARRAAAAKAKREAQARAAAKAKAAQKAAAARRNVSHSSSHSASGSSSGVSSSSSSHHGFIYPVNGPITSPYGMRLHPILHVWKLHDGTDFGAGCGTPIHAPYSGKVVEKYYNAGYGNRLIIDHGKVDGHYITTAMNHAIRYTVGVGAHVQQGQVIGYVGETGYATGCHLHLMVWEDGTMVNPMSWY